MNALEFNNKIANLITKFITNIPTIGQFDPSRSQRPNKDFHSNHRTGKPKLPVKPK